MTAPTLEEARALDAADPLAWTRAEFDLPPGIYLDGNSLGPPPRGVAARVDRLVRDEWGRSLIAGWTGHGWVDAPARVGAAIARLIGAGEGGVVVADSTSVNLFKLTVAAARLQPDRGEVVAEAGNFPTVLHVARSAAELAGKRLRVVPPGDLEAAIGADTAVAVLAHVHYRTGARHDLAALTAHGRAAGAPILWDLSHSVGALPLQLARDGVELAVGCGYKYLNGGPGAPAFLHVAPQLADRLRNPIAGWFGHAAPFDFTDDYRPAPGVARFLAGTPPVLGLAALEEGVALAARADPRALWAKSCALWDLFTGALDHWCPELELVTPRDPDRRGSHASYRHPHAHEVVQALIARGVTGDFRAPDIARFGLTPLTLGHEEVWRAADALRQVMTGGEWRDPRHAVRGRIT